MKPPYKFPMKCGFTDMQLNIGAGELRKYVADTTTTRKPDYLLTRKEFLEQIEKPLYTIDLDKGLQAYKLQKHLKRIHAALSLKCNEFTRSIPNLPGISDMACIQLTTELRGPVDVVLSLSNLYCHGACVVESKVFYENTDKDCATNPTSTGFLVEGSIPLGFLGHSYKAFGIDVPIELTGSKFEDAYCALAKLGTPEEDLKKALHGLGMFALLFIEPVRQRVVQQFLLGEPGKNKSDDKYGTLTSEGTTWDAIHSWGQECLTAQGFKKEADHVLREDTAVDSGKRAAALGNVLLINYAGILYYL